MAIRTLTRPTFHRFITSTSNPIPISSGPRIRSFSSNSSSPVTISPDFSQQSEYRKLISLANIFQRYGFPPSQLHDFLTKNRFFLRFNPSEIQNSLKILLSLKLSQEFLVSMVINCPRVLELEFIKKWEVGVSEMGVSIVTSLMIRNVLEVSRKFDLGPDDLFRCVQRLKGVGFSDGTVIRILEEFPMVIMMGENQVCDKIEFLVGFGMNKSQIDRTFNSFPGILRFGVENKLKALFGEFKDLGFSNDVVRKEIIRDPRVLGLELGEFSRCLQMLRTLKCRVPIKERIFSEGAFRAGFEVKLRIDCLCRHGLIYRDAFKVLWKEPRAILYKIEDIDQKIEFLVNRMKFNVLWLVDIPEYLGVNFEKQIVPRYNVIEYLSSKGGLGDEVGLKTLIKSSRLRFYNLYVKPYPECEKMFGRFAGDVEVRNQHPVGLWKLFKPKKYPESKEDVKNIKYFMEPFV
ncbi:transcription termination factor MTERF15, mitochondrial [Cornus florida]|uniref:transcription termination factor MTERF15, mitochondrial n=1 Tax=Cornus florida TaxID=4283 RepID=UPI002896C38E|nr:transcription termination factor MTERF15, mitochondrial [Cornus florida]XP_059642221.1 transcription termination factor MTERF15, mitochondrial [Cornus florida]XP_059642222.1 transcription termination factor MTERF15, mitochondrial [Cornus florida]